MMAADMFLIPVDGGSFSLNGLADLLDALEEVKETENVPILRSGTNGPNKIS